MLWHEAAQRLDDDSTSSVRSAPLQSSRSVDTVYKYNRRLVIVKAGHGFCWCVPISTYGTHGLRRAGLTTEDIEAHAIIFVESDRPRPLVGEPAISKRPIAVVPASEDQRLDPASRINFAKVYTVEHNAKVMDIGRVSDRSMPRFKQYFQEQLKLE